MNADRRLEPKLINSKRPMESTGSKEAEILTMDNTDERGSEIGAETHKPRKGDGKHREPSKCGMRALGAAATGDCGVRIANCGLGSSNGPQPGAAHGQRRMRKARNNEKAKPAPNERRPSQIGPVKAY